jgi:hypothetical protein
MTENEQQPALKAPWVKSPQGIVEVYANSMHITWSLDDVRIRLAQLVTDPEHPNPGPEYRGVTEERAAATFSWRTAKLLRDSLTKLIEHYEQVNGEIKVKIELPANIP